jgi:superfamily II DNA/RNA helicase
VRAKLTKQVDILTNLRIKSCATTADNKAKDPKLWEKVDRGEYNIVYATPEEILDPLGHFLTTTIKNTPFMRKICCVAVDECHLIWDWETFRPKYRYVGNLRLVLSGVPWVCLSATLSPNVAAYVHEVCHLERPTALTTITTKRDNINIVVSEIESNTDTEPLLKVIVPPGIRGFPQIPKTLIFLDDVEGGIRLGNELQFRLHEVTGMDSSAAIVNYYSTLDAESKSEHFTNLKNGTTRVIVCTDAFAMGVNIRDIARVIQFRVCEKLQFSGLTQRFGRAGRDPRLEAVGMVFVQRNVLSSTRTWNEDLSKWDDEWDDPTLYEESDDDDETGLPNVIPVSKEREFARFSIPVTVETKAYVKFHSKRLFKQVKSVRDAHRQAKLEGKGRRGHELPISKKIHPHVLWFLRSQGCRHMVMGYVFQDPKLYEKSHKYWCCDNCLFDKSSSVSRRYPHPSGVWTHGIPASMSISAPPRNDPPQNAAEVERARGPTRPGDISEERANRVRYRLGLFREHIRKLRSIPFITAEMVLPDPLMEEIVNNVKYIVAESQLYRVMEKHKFHVRRSLLSESDMSHIILIINQCMEEPIVWRTPRLSVDTSIRPDSS